MCTARCTHTSTTSYANIVIINKRNGWKSTQDAVFWVLRCGLVNLYDLHAYMFLCFFCACCCPFCWREAGGRIIIIKMKKNKRRKLQYNIGFYITHRFLPFFFYFFAVLLFCSLQCSSIVSRVGESTRLWNRMENLSLYIFLANAHRTTIICANR